jgi:hypothetical protein
MNYHHKGMTVKPTLADAKQRDNFLTAQHEIDPKQTKRG